MSKGYFVEDGVVRLFTCPKCNYPNSSHNIDTGICIWCHYDANKAYQKSVKKTKKR